MGSDGIFKPLKRQGMPWETIRNRQSWDARSGKGIKPY